MKTIRINDLVFKSLLEKAKKKKFRTVEDYLTFISGEKE